MIGSHARHSAAAHPVTASKRAFRARIWLASAMWVPVLAANLGAIALALLLPMLDRRLDEGERPPISIGAAQQIFGALAAGMITFAGITFSAVFVAAQLTVMFGGHDYLRRTTGITYADYVHQGFAQMNVATALTLIVVAGAAYKAARATSRDRTLLRVALGLLCFGLFSFVEARYRKVLQA